MKCPKCERPTLEQVRDRVTGDFVKDDGRFLLRCSNCHETIIADKKTLDGLKGLAARPSVLWWVSGGLGMLGTLTNYLFQWTFRGGPQAMQSRYIMPALGAMLLVFLLRLMVWLLLEAKGKSAKEKFENYFGFVLVLALTGFFIWAFVTGVARDREYQRRQAPAARTTR